MKLPLSFGVAADAVPIFYFEQGDRRAFAVTSLVEIFISPPINRASVEKLCHESLVTQQFEQETLFFIILGALRIH